MTKVFGHTRSLPSHLAMIGLLGMLPLFFVGCGSGLVPVSGTVTVDGNPASGVVILFLPMSDDSAIPATAVSDESGNFVLMTDMQNGIRKGSYKINANWPDPNYKPPKAKGLNFGDPEPAPDLLKGKYMGQSSVATRDISSALNDLKLELEL
jgi:hypothetical protein